LIPKNRRIVVASILGGLHHEYGSEEMAAADSFFPRVFFAFCEEDS
jgi:hypothetical protein